MPMVSIVIDDKLAKKWLQGVYDIGTCMKSILKETRNVIAYR